MKGNQIFNKTHNKKLLSFSKIEKFINMSLQKKYFINELVYGSRVISNIIYNKKTHIVATFKDYLISDDLSEFLKRFYTTFESSIRLPKYYEYYETYSRIYPNYTALRESKYIYKNIHKKQIMIDLQQKMEEYEIKKKEKNKNKNKRNKDDYMVFSTDIYNSIVNDNEDFYNLLFGINKNLQKKEKSIEEFKKLIKEIEKCEKEIPNSSFALEQFVAKKKNPINNKNKSIAGKLFSACTKQMITTSKNDKSGNYKNILNEIQLIKSSTSITHKKKISSSSGNNSINKKKHYSKINNINNKSYNNILPYTFQNNKTSEINDLMNKVKVNINSSDISIKNGSETERINNKNSINIKNNIFNHNRNHNCLLNAKGILISHNNNSINISHNKKKFFGDKNIKFKGIISPTNNNEKNKERKVEKNTLRTNDFHLLRNKNKSNSNPKNKKIINNNINSIITLSTINNSCQTLNHLKKMKYKNVHNINYYSTEKNNININTINNSNSKNKRSKNKSSSPSEKRIIEGIKIKNFNKALKLSETISPKYESNKTKKIIKYSKPKTSRVTSKKKYT